MSPAHKIIVLILLIILENAEYPVPHSHKTFELGAITIDSNFDSGNLYNAEKTNNTNFNIWIAVDHPKNQYRAWFHFSIKGQTKGTVLTFNIKNMQNQSRLLREGLVPVYREEGSQDWKRIAHKVDLSRIEHNQGWIEWTFKHTATSTERVFIAFFYPWSNTDNNSFLQGIQEKSSKQTDLYFKRSCIMKTIEGRPVQFLTISSKKWILNRNEKFQNQHLFGTHRDEPREFGPEKKCFIIGARVHPGEVPSSHVMTGIISSLTEDCQKARLLRDKFVFYLFPIFNPDGVARGHYRVDTNGINLNRCYINPSPKNHPSIYAVKKVITHFHLKQKYFGFLDLHAHAARKGVFIYGNSTNELDKQVNICLFPKILSLNSEIFEYEGSNFTEKNMYCKDINDHVSKEGAGRVALFKATKNPFCWTLECNYNSSRVINPLVEPRSKDEAILRPTQKDLDAEQIINHKSPDFKEPKQFYTIEHFRKLGKQICDSLLDLIELNPESRIDNPRSYFKSVQGLKLHLAVALLRMAPNRFEMPFKKIYHNIESPSSSKESAEKGLRALYYLLIRKAKIQNLSVFLKDGDDSQITLPVNKSPAKHKAFSTGRQRLSPPKNLRHARSNGQERNLQMMQSNQLSRQNVKMSRESLKMPEEECTSPLKPSKVESDYKFLDSDESDYEQSPNSCAQINFSSLSEHGDRRKEVAKVSSALNSQLLQINFQSNYQRLAGKGNQNGGQSFKAYRKSFNSETKKFICNPVVELKPQILRPQPRELPTLVTSKIKAMVCISSLDNQIRLIKKGKSKDSNIFYFPNEVV